MADEPADPTPEELAELLRLYRALPPAVKLAILQWARLLADDTPPTNPH